MKETLNTMINLNTNKIIRYLRSIILVTLVTSIGLSATKAYAQEDFSSTYKLYKQAVEKQNNSDAIKFAKQALSYGEIKFGAQSENTTNLKYNLALAYITDKQAAPAFELLNEIKQDYRQLFGEYSIEHYRSVLEQLGTAKLHIRSDYKKRKRAYSHIVSYAINLAEEISEAEPERASFVYYDLARVLNLTPLNSDFFQKVFKVNQTTEELLLAQFGENDMKTLEIQFMLAKFFQAKNKKNNAIEYFEKVITTVTLAIDTSHPYELASHAALVQLYEKRGKSEEATKHCLAIGRMTPWSDEIKPLPLYRQDPIYPKSMVRAGKGGFVELEFVISNFGFVQDIKVINSSDKGFEKASLEALAKWRYAPKIVAGQAVASEKLKVRLDYTLG